MMYERRNRGFGGATMGEPLRVSVRSMASYVILFLVTIRSNTARISSRLRSRSMLSVCTRFGTRPAALASLSRRNSIEFSSTAILPTLGATLTKVAGCAKDGGDFGSRGPQPNANADTVTQASQNMRATRDRERGGEGIRIGTVAVRPHGRHATSRLT